MDNATHTAPNAAALVTVLGISNGRRGTLCGAKHEIVVPVYAGNGDDTATHELCAACKLAKTAARSL